MMSSCWHFSFSISSQYLSVQSMEFGWDLGLDGARAFLLFFLFLFWDTWVTCLGIGTIGFSWASGLFFFFSFWGTCRFTQAMECILGQGMDGTVELKINLD